MTNKKENFIRHLQAGTKNKSIKWKAISLSSYNNIIHNSDKLTRLFETSYKDKNILLAETKVLAFEEDAELFIEDLKISLYIISDNTLEFIINDNYVSDYLLYGLIDVVAEETHQLNDFFDDFIENTVI